MAVSSGACLSQGCSDNNPLTETRQAAPGFRLLQARTIVTGARQDAGRSDVMWTLAVTARTSQPRPAGPAHDR